MEMVPAAYSVDNFEPSPLQELVCTMSGCGPFCRREMPAATSADRVATWPAEMVPAAYSVDNFEPRPVQELVCTMSGSFPLRRPVMAVATSTDWCLTWRACRLLCG
ncbi:uncharacterized protein LOC125942631 isoform X2 [Dermacentor silvarum]|uniref:uncharacterized protein LOC125942631 isoform X2 n=1 Tax=Dermacentor silvarum TaxID=543639 RepID=UPI002101C1FF|nr:uncharacterized protein LOC125942631 isoform X2 [Dermacentor silvarum]